MSSSTPIRILIVEDNDILARNLCRHIERNSPYQADCVPDGLDAVERICKDQPDLVVLDVGLPSLDGYEVCLRVRPQYAGPILFMTGEKKRDEDQLTGFEVGADDYVVKPVSFQVLLARIESLLRRSSQPSPRLQSSPSDCQLSEIAPLAAGELYVDPIEHWLRFADLPKIPLTPNESVVLWLLVRAEGKPVTKGKIFLTLKGKAWDGTSRVPDMVVSKVRKKLEQIKGRPAWIATEKNVGYTLVVRQK